MISDEEKNFFLCAGERDLLENGEIGIVLVPQDEIEGIERRRSDVARKFGRPPAQHRDFFQFYYDEKRREKKYIKGIRLSMVD